MPSEGNFRSHQWRRWLVERVSAVLSVEPAAVDVRACFRDLGVDSMQATLLADQIARASGHALPITLLWEHPSIAALSQYLEGGGETEVPGSSTAMSREPIAIVGIACRFPGAQDVEAFWQLLREGREAVGGVPRARWDVDAYFDPDPQRTGHMYTRRMGTIEGVDAFDASFFRTAPAEAAQMDPQQRVLLELTWEALEDAGIPPTSLRGTDAGVFVGAWRSDYAMLITQGAVLETSHSATGQDLSVIAGRISYAFGLEGPSFVTTSACSSSLVAMHLAAQAINAGEVSLAIVGGVNLVLSPDSTIAMCRLGALSADGRCKAFDASADGYVRSDGAAVIILKRASCALRDGDRVYAVMRGSAINNDGASNGLTAPSPRAQKAVLRAAYARAGVDASTVQYIETHGTGTRLGDPIEAGALGAVLCASRSRPLLIGSVKTNIGHTEAAAGLAGVVKVLLSMEHRTVPPSLHFAKPNPAIDFEALRLRVPVRDEAWPADQEQMRAGVSSFGFGGTNAHVVLEEVVAPAPLELRISATDRHALVQRARKAMEAVAHGEHLVEDPSRSARLGAWGSTREELAARVDAALGGEASDGASVAIGGARCQTAFIFTGQGTQWNGMGRSLLATDESFRRTFEACDHAARELTPRTLADALVFGPREDVIEQWPTLVAFGLALAASWRHRGVEPSAVVGHSIGEIAAAHVSGALRLEDAMTVVCAEAELVNKLAGSGGMLAIDLDAEAAAREIATCGGDVEVAVEASPRSVIVAGSDAALAEVATRLARDGVLCRRVATNVPAHTRRLEAFADTLRARLRHLQANAPCIPFFSACAGKGVVHSLDAGHWARHLVEPVRFASAIAAAAKSGITAFVEIAPHAVLTRAVHDTVDAFAPRTLVLATARRGVDERATMAEAHAALYTAAGAAPRLQCNLEDGGSAMLLPISARSPAALRAGATGLAQALEQGDAPSLHDACFTLACRRSHLEVRRAVVVCDRPGAVEHLRAIAADADAPRCASQLTIAFVFGGQGGQWIGMGRRLFAREPIYRDTLLRCDEAIRSAGGTSVLAAIDGQGAQEIDAVQPAIFAVQVALAALWRSWGIVPAYVVGQSLGEVAAAHVGGALDLATAARVICTRSRLMRRVRGQGGMAIVDLPAQALDEYLGPQLSIAVCASPSSTGVAGTPQAIEALVARLRQANIFCRAVNVDVAAHSPQVEPLVAPLAEALADIQPCPLQVPMISTVVGRPVSGEELDAVYWTRNLRDRVLFAQAMEVLLGNGTNAVVELDPHPIVGIAVEQCARHAARDIAVVSSMERDEDDHASALSALGALFERGAEVRWKGVYRGGRFVRLPHYAWQRRRYWFEGDAAARARPATAARTDPRSWIHELVWESCEAPAVSERETLSWVVVGGSSNGEGVRLASTLRARGTQCAVVADAAGVASALSDMPPECRVVHLALDTHGEAAASARTMLEQARDTCSAALTAARAMRSGDRLWVVTRGAQSMGGETADPIAATLWGLGRSLALELSDRWGGLIDLDRNAPPVDAQQLVAAVSGRAPGSQWALRQETWFAPRLRPVATESLGSTHALSSDSSYLVTGGIGAVGQRVVRWLIGNGARHVAIVGRTTPGDGVLEALASPEARVRFFNADVSDEASLEAVIEALDPPLCGVVHAAGVYSEARHDLVSSVDLERVMRPKVAGAWALHRATRDRLCDLFVLFSSAAAIWGAAGLAAYGAANSFLDALAAARRAAGLPATSIAWGRWPRGGMVSDTAAELLERIGLLEMDADGALTAMRELLASGRDRAVIARVDWKTLAALHASRGAGALFTRELSPRADAETGSRDSALVRRLREVHTSRRQGIMTQHVLAEVRALLGFAADDPLDPTQGFFALGMDSVTSVQLVRRLEASLGRKLSAVLALEYPTAEKLAAELVALTAAQAPAQPTGCANIAELDDERSLEACLDDQVEQVLRK